MEVHIDSLIDIDLAQLSLQETPPKQLPKDVIHTIFSHLQPIDLARCSGVCRRWRTIANEFSLWEKYVFGPKALPLPADQLPSAPPYIFTRLLWRSLSDPSKRVMDTDSLVYTPCEITNGTAATKITSKNFPFSTTYPADHPGLWRQVRQEYTQPLELSRWALISKPCSPHMDKDLMRALAEKQNSADELVSRVSLLSIRRQLELVLPDNSLLNTLIVNEEFETLVQVLASLQPSFLLKVLQENFILYRLLAHKSIKEETLISIIDRIVHLLPTSKDREDFVSDREAFTFKYNLPGPRLGSQVVKTLLSHFTSPQSVEAFASQPGLCYKMIEKDDNSQKLAILLRACRPEKRLALLQADPAIMDRLAVIGGAEVFALFSDCRELQALVSSDTFAKSIKEGEFPALLALFQLFPEDTWKEIAKSVLSVSVHAFDPKTFRFLKDLFSQEEADEILRGNDPSKNLLCPLLAELVCYKRDEYPPSVVKLKRLISLISHPTLVAALSEPHLPVRPMMLATESQNVPCFYALLNNLSEDERLAIG